VQPKASGRFMSSLRLPWKKSFAITRTAKATALVFETVDTKLKEQDQNLDLFGTTRCVTPGFRSSAIRVSPHSLLKQRLKFLEDGSLLLLRQEIGKVAPTAHR
jgi:hypothetical protein